MEKKNYQNSATKAAQGESLLSQNKVIDYSNKNVT